MKKPYRRRNYFISKRFQGWVILHNMAIVIVGGLLVLAMFSFISWKTMTITYDHSRFRMDKTPLVLMPEIIGVYGAYLLIVGLTIGFIALFLSHRISGPIYRIRRSLDDIQGGDLTVDIRLRQRDERDIKDLAERLNALTADLGMRISRAKEDAGRIGEAVEELRGLCPEGQAASDALNRAQSAAERLAAEVGFFRTRGGGDERA